MIPVLRPHVRQAPLQVNPFRHSRHFDFDGNGAATIRPSKVNPSRHGLRWVFAGTLCIALAACGGGSSGGGGNGGAGTSTYTVTATAGSGGAISPSQATVAKGATTSFTVTPTGGYVIGTVSGCNGSLSGSTYTTGAVSGNCTVTATFIATHTVTATAGTGGSVSPATTVVHDGSTTGITVTPAAGYAIGTVTGCGGSLSSTTYTTGAVTADCTVTASFVVANQWTWMGGSNGTDASGVYGTPGIAASSNIPGARSGAVTWAGANGNLWLFGGTGFDSNGSNNELNDLWRYDLTAHQWTWMKGYASGDQPGVYGTQGTAATTNTPGTRNRPLSWIDQSGQLWLFGGLGEGAVLGTNWLNDLWVYNPTSNDWTWMGGSKNGGSNGVYGTQGTPDSNNIPGARYLSASWTDAAGHFWLFGGVGLDSAGTYGLMNDLWEYDPASNKWTWVTGSNTVNAAGNYGTLGVPAGTNMPGARDRAMAWTDTNGNLWLFGGNGLDSNGATNDLNDLWEYDTGTGQWTWMGGSTTFGAKGVYGTQGTADAANVPGAREGASAWSDKANGLFWLFAGSGVDANGATGELNDLWQYNLQTKEWTWVGGSDTRNASGSYGTQGTNTITNIPGARDGAAKWSDGNGHLWLFGGHGYGASSQGLLNDLWQYQP